MLRIITAAAILTLTGNVALADSQVSINVPFGDLNLSQTQDARVLAHRLQTAAERVCLQANDADLAKSRAGQVALQQCVDTAISIAMERIEANLVGKVRANLVSVKQIEASR